MKVTISEGNTKLGKVHNISLPPVLTCQKDVPCSKKCYALKAWKMYNAVRDCWNANLDAWKEDAMGYFEFISNYCAEKHVERFRWHVAGDIPSTAYYNGMVLVAMCNPQTQFLAFTKNFDVIGLPRPENLKLVASMWPGLMAHLGLGKPEQTAKLRELKSHAGIAWMDPGTRGASFDPWYADMLDTEVHEESIECTGQCDECFLCWYLDPGSSVVFKQH